MKIKENYLEKKEMWQNEKTQENYRKHHTVNNRDNIKCHIQRKDSISKDNDIIIEVMDACEPPNFKDELSNEGIIKNEQKKKSLVSIQAMDAADYDLVSADWKGLYEKFRTQGIYRKEIETAIGARFHGQLYKNSKMRYSTFKKLLEFYGKPIEHKIFREFKAPFSKMKNQDRVVYELRKPDVAKIMDYDYVKADWSKIYHELRLQGFSKKRINQELGTQFDSQIYGGYNMKYQYFKKLEKLLGKKIEYQIINRRSHFDKQLGKFRVSHQGKTLFYEMINKDDLHRDLIDQDYISADWINIYQNLKDQGLNLKTISEKIGVNFASQLYNDYTMKFKNFKILLEIADFGIDYQFVNKDYKIAQRDKRYQDLNTSPKIIREYREPDMKNIKLSDKVQASWKKILLDLNRAGVSKGEITKCIGSSFTHQYNGNRELRYNNFRILQKLYMDKCSKSIEYIILDQDSIDRQREKQIKIIMDKIPGNKYIKKVDAKFSEFLGIVHGDGHLSFKGEVKITLDKWEIEYAEYIKKMMMDEFGIIPRIKPRKGENTLDIRIGNKKFVSELQSLGMRTGDKTRNQSEVPSIIFMNSQNMRNFAIGLFDTDGCAVSYDSYYGIIFTNKNKNLLNFFADFCFDNNVACSIYSTNSIRIVNKNDISLLMKLLDSYKVRSFITKNKLDNMVQS
ncbi:MAG: LAGLIDADG family homing endonuclease [Candidatus Heimdallarchaeota archaeon]|nr:LAGLIDADG family homing endonuclease [Candidatus Heimdallarchaeota archaeon]